MRRKHNVRFGGIKPEMVVAIMMMGPVFLRHGTVLKLTSIVDGVHGVYSYHPSGYAGDFGLPAKSKGLNEIIVSDLKVVLGPEYDVILEPDHIHVEFDVRRASQT